jgi:predicted Kef-type K+ transport protein
MAAATLLFGSVMLGLGALGLPLVSDLSVGQAALVGFALSFSSTVFAVKVLEERGEAASLAGRLAVGMLVMQDIFAVVFLAVSEQKWPSLLAIPVVIAVVAARPIYGWILDRSGHGELLILLGFCLAVGVGGASFEAVGLKPDLGALVIGITLSGHPRVAELSDRLLGFKDILLIGFFLSIGLGGAPTPAAAMVAGVALLLLPLRGIGHFLVGSWFHLRARTSWHKAFTLGQFSEFGLIVAAAGVSAELLDEEWTTAIALAVAVSFVIAAPLAKARYVLFRRFSDKLHSLERQPIAPDDAVIDPGDARVLVFGMGRIGTGAYDELVLRQGEVVLGVDRSDSVVAENEQAGRRVVRGDALDAEFWARVCLRDGTQLVLLAMSDHEANVAAAEQVRNFLPNARVAASAHYADQIRELESVGVDVARDLYGEAGQGLADDACDLLFGQRT